MERSAEQRARLANVHISQDDEQAGMTCPRCGYHEETRFDSLAMQPKHLPETMLLPVWKCPNCKHLFALRPEFIPEPGPHLGR